MTEISQPAGAAQSIYVVGVAPQTDFPVPFYFDAREDLAVFVAGVPTTAFTLVATFERQGIFIAATVRMNTPVVSSTVIINRETRLQQGAVWPLSGAFNVFALNREFARLWQAVQDLGRVARSAVVGPSNERSMAPLPAAALRAGYLVGFNEDGDPLVTTIAVNGPALSAVGQSVAFAASQGAARAAIAAAPSASPSFTGGITVAGGATIDDARPGAVHGGPLAGLRNRLINGDMAVDQRYAGNIATVAPPGVYVVDRWLVVPSGANATGQRVAGDSAGRFLLEMKRSSASTSSIVLRQRIEAQSIADLVGKRITLSFIARHTAVFSVTISLAHANALDNFSATTPIVSALVPVRTHVAVNPPPRIVWVPPAVLPAGAANGLQLSIDFALPGPASWFMGEMQLEEGMVATPFERRPPALETSLCQRFYEAGEGAVEVQAGGRWADSAQFTTRKRALPAVITSTTAHVNLTASDSHAFILLNGMRNRHTFSGAGLRDFAWIADAEL